MILEIGGSSIQSHAESLSGLTQFENSHLFLMLVESALNLYLGKLATAFGYEPEFGGDFEYSSPVDFGDLLTHMSLVRVAEVYNSNAQMCLKDYLQEGNSLSLEDAYDFLKHSVELAPPRHLERGLAHAMLGEYHLHLAQHEEALSQLEQALQVLACLGTEECVEHENRVRVLLEKCQPQSESVK
ncbi:tetratricopeptide repeat protein [Tumebacillus flagellatus]|uniref:tetratricopeptide repeat protein n=1 Tax=Tumebacillus flagellatus TaxID=1157490 RepID=UPI0012684865|nr:tetratricopeptide repeat protein [Tumebacillus flagellatus]